MSISAHPSKLTLVAAIICVASACAIGVADAQTRGAVAAAQPQGPSQPNALQGFSQNRNQPVAIESTTLEVRDKDKMATFLGNVKLVQGDTTMYCKTLVVYYEQGAGGAGGPTAAQAGPGGNQQIKRIEAKGNVKVTQKDQVATGDSGVYDTAANKVTLLGNVVITQGPQVVKGDALSVDLETGYSRVECKSSNCRVQALIVPGSKDNPLGPHPGQPGQPSQGGQAAPPPPGPANQPGQGNRPATRGTTGAASPLRPQGLY
jgi:lipopolysaccharide export system protein LptA